MNSKVELKWIDSNTVDVFTGKGWGNWTRFTVKRIKGRVYLTKTGGQALDQDVYKDLCKSLETTKV